MSGSGESGPLASEAPWQPFCARSKKVGSGHTHSGRPEPGEKGGHGAPSRGGTQSCPPTPTRSGETGFNRDCLRSQRPHARGRASVVAAPRSNRANNGLWIAPESGRLGTAPKPLLPAQSFKQATRPHGRSSCNCPGHAGGTGAQPGCASRSWAGGRSERPASPRADLGGFLFLSSASVPFISGDGQQERKVTPQGQGSAWNRPLLLPWSRPLSPPTKIPSRWFSSQEAGVGCWRGGRRTSLRLEPLFLPDWAPSPQEADWLPGLAPGASPIPGRPQDKGREGSLGSKREGAAGEPQQARQSAKATWRCVRQCSCHQQARAKDCGLGLSGAHSLPSPWNRGLVSVPSFLEHLTCIQDGPTFSHCQPILSVGSASLAGLGLASEGGSPGAPSTKRLSLERGRQARVNHQLLSLAFEPNRKVGKFVQPSLFTHSFQRLNFLLQCSVKCCPRPYLRADLWGCTNDPELWQGRFWLPQ